jgi:hypothetical protein
MYYLIYRALGESTKFKQYLTPDLSIKFVVESYFYLAFNLNIFVLLFTNKTNPKIV